MLLGPAGRRGQLGFMWPQVRSRAWFDRVLPSRDPVGEAVVPDAAVVVGAAVDSFVPLFAVGELFRLGVDECDLSFLVPGRSCDVVPVDPRFRRVVL